MPVWPRAKPGVAAVELASDSDSKSSSSDSVLSAHERAQSASLSTISGHSSPKSVPPHLLVSSTGFRVVPNASLPNLVSSIRAVKAPPQLQRTQSNPEFALVPKKVDSLAVTRITRSNSMARILKECMIADTMRILVIGAPQVGKSSLVNGYRATVTNNVKWPAAPVGMCGFCGTTTVDPFPNHPMEPTWVCIDTPGKVYDTENQTILEKLFAGVPWKTRLAGRNALRFEELQHLPSVPENKPHQCIIVVPATDLIEDRGWMSVFRFRERYCSAPDADGMIMYLRSLVCSVRSLLCDAAPFIVVTKMDLVGGAGCIAARRALTLLLTQCIPLNRLFFCACPEEQPLHESKRRWNVDYDSRESFLRLHEDLSLSFRWRKSLEDRL